MVEIYERAGEAAEVSADIAVKGAGVAVGAIGASIVGGILERGIIGQTTQASTAMKKLGAWAINNVPKGLISYGVHVYNPKRGMAEKGITGDFIDGVSYGAAADVALDTLGRALNKGAPVTTTIASPVMEAAGLEKHPDYNVVADRMNTLLAENSTLRRKVMESDLETPPVKNREKGFQFMPDGGYPGSGGLERKYEFTEPIPGVVKEKRPAEKQFQFTTPNGKVVSGSVTDSKVLTSGFGFIV